MKGETCRRSLCESFDAFVSILHDTPRPEPSAEVDLKHGETPEIIDGE
ncbi:MAG: hypothetical protein ACR2KW_05970 [Rubrobacter sp.]